MEKFYTEKYKILNIKYIELFNIMLNKKNVINNEKSVILLARKVKKYYPNLSKQISLVINNFMEEYISENEIESLINLYKIIVEECNGEL